MAKKAIFIGATGQNVGKTTLCLGLLSGLKKRFARVGFIKPVGQQHVKVEGGLCVDKDAVLFKEYFKLTSDYADMSPVIIPSGFTRRYLDGEISESGLADQIQLAYRKIVQSNDYTIVEGTGHIGVGSIVNMCNARVASDLGLEIVIISLAGLGVAHDELALNLALCHAYGVKVKGIILNRVLNDKRAMISEYFPKSLKKWGVPLIGCVPYNELLSTPSIKDFSLLFNAPLLFGEKHRFRHFARVRMVAGSLDSYHADIIPHELIITPASREDIIMATRQRCMHAMQLGIDFEAGMILTSKQTPSAHILRAMRGLDIPIMYVPQGSYEVMKTINAFTAKIRVEDTSKVEKAISLVEDNVDFEMLY